MAASIRNVRNFVLYLRNVSNLSSSRCQLAVKLKTSKVCAPLYSITRNQRYLCSDSKGNESSTSPQDSTQAKTKKLNLSKPKGRQKMVQSESEDDSSSSDSSSDSSDEESEQLVSAAKEVAESLGGDVKKTESDLLSQLRKHQELTQNQKMGELPPPSKVSLSEIYSEMKIDKARKSRTLSEESHEGTRPPMRRNLEQGESILRQMQRTPKRKEPVKDMKLFEGSALGIFSAESTRDVVKTDKVDLFSRIEQEEFEKACYFPPVNRFEEMIRWTQEGKMWPFPIDNEYGMKEEENVGFHEHVFLEHLLEHFPARGPVRVFMEFVINGLSKNPYLTVRQKHEHVMWFRDYFNDKKQILEELMKSAQDNTSQKQQIH